MCSNNFLTGNLDGYLDPFPIDCGYIQDTVENAIVWSTSCPINPAWMELNPKKNGANPLHPFLVFRGHVGEPAKPTGFDASAFPCYFKFIHAKIQSGPQYLSSSSCKSISENVEISVPTSRHCSRFELSFRLQFFHFSGSFQRTTATSASQLWVRVWHILS